MVDAVIICTPPNMHYEIARHFLAQRQPRAVREAAHDRRRARRRAGRARRSETASLLMMASKFRYVDDIIKAKAIIEAGILGRVVLYENTLLRQGR